MQKPVETVSPTPDASLPVDARERRPYESPAILEDLPLETFSLACGKISSSCGPPPFMS